MQLAAVKTLASKLKAPSTSARVLRRPDQRKMILTHIAPPAPPHWAALPRTPTRDEHCVRCWMSAKTCRLDHWRRGHKQMCKKIHRGGNAEQYNADKKYTGGRRGRGRDVATRTREGPGDASCTQALHYGKRRRADAARVLVPRDGGPPRTRGVLGGTGETFLYAEAPS